MRLHHRLPFELRLSPPPLPTHHHHQTWRWGVYTEFNNADWYNAGNTSFLDLYDYTVCGLQKALGDGFSVGAHGCTQCFMDDPRDNWDPLELLTHVKR
jgi:hypothetical protein